MPSRFAARFCGLRKAPDKEAFRPRHEIEEQYEASRSFAPAVTELPPIAHQYSAGQAATLAWMAGRGPAPLTFGETAEMSGPYSVQRLEQWAQELLARPDDPLFPRPYVIGVDYVCRWAQRGIDLAPFPAADARPCAGGTAAGG